MKVKTGDKDQLNSSESKNLYRMQKYKNQDVTNFGEFLSVDGELGQPCEWWWPGLELSLFGVRHRRLGVWGCGGCGEESFATPWYWIGLWSDWLVPLFIFPFYIVGCIEFIKSINIEIQNGTKSKIRLQHFPTLLYNPTTFYYSLAGDLVGQRGTTQNIDMKVSEISDGRSQSVVLTFT